jgi:hypothetical protein
MSALQLRKQGVDKSVILRDLREDQLQTKETKIDEELVRGNVNLPISRSSDWGASGEVAQVATYKSTSRSPVPREARSCLAMGRPVQSQSPSRGLDRPSSHKDGAVAFGAA